MQILYTLYFLLLFIAILATLFLLSKKKIRNPMPLLFIFSFLIIIPIFFGYFAIVYSSEKPEVATPNLKGLPIEQAIEILRNRKLKFKIQEQLYTANTPHGQVIKHYPDSGQRIKEGRTISLIISLGKQSLIMPKLVGHHFKQIEPILKASDLIINKIDKVYSKIQGNGTVVSQYPPEGSTIEAGSGIDITISIDPDKEDELEDSKEENNNE